MDKTKTITVVGHRGARGYAPENSAESLRMALKLGVDIVEFDTWTSKDGTPFLQHDADFMRLVGKNKKIFDMSDQEIKKLKTIAGTKIITAQEALNILGMTPTYLEIKDFYLSAGVVNALKEHKNSNLMVGSYNHKVLLELRKKRPEIELFAGTVWHPMETLRFIRRHKLDGLTLQYRWFNPFIYWYCRRYNIKIMLFTVNQKWCIKHLERFYPGLMICSDYPDRVTRAIAESAKSRKT